VAYELLLELGKFAVGSGVIGTFAWKLFDSLLARDLNSYKAQIDAQHARELEQFKAGIRSAAFEHEIRFSRLHEQRVRIIAKLYRLLNRASVAFEAWTAPLSSDGETYEEKGKKASEAATALFTFLERIKYILMCGCALRLRNCETNSAVHGLSSVRAWRGRLTAAQDEHGEIREQIF